MEAGFGGLKSCRNPHRIERSRLFESPLDDLPSEPALLQHLIRDMAAAVEHRGGEIERLRSIIKKLQRAQFGRRSERLDPDQLALALEEIDSDIAREEEKRPRGEKQTVERSSRRKPLPDHLQREDVRLDIESMTCSCCGGALRVIGESVSEMLDWIPAQLRVIRTTRPKYACRICATIVEAAALERPIAGGLATPALLAQVLVSKYCDHTPLYRQSQIFARHGVDLPRSTLAGWVGGACWWLEALHERLARNVFASDYLLPTIRRSRCGPERRPPSICSRRTGKPNVQLLISSTSRGIQLVWGIVCQARFIKSLLLSSSFRLVNSDVPRGALHDQRGSSRRILVCG